MTPQERTDAILQQLQTAEDRLVATLDRQTGALESLAESVARLAAAVETAKAGALWRNR